jgi:hypothetical protein
MPDPLVVTTLRQFRVALGLREDALVESMAGQWLEIENRLDAQIGLLAREMADLQAAGKPITEQLVWRQQRYQVLKGQMQTEMAKYNAEAVKTISQAQTFNATLGIDAAQNAIMVQYGPFGTTFNRINVGAVESMIGFAGDGSPLRSLLAEDYPDAVDGLLKALINGMARGQSPVQTAREMKDGMAGGLQRALVIARTETARAYRMASTEQYRQSGVVRGFRRLVFRQKACLACLFLDGEWFELASELDDHPVGLCQALPCLNGIADPQWETGPAYFLGLTADEQEAKMGPGMYAAWKDGKFELSDLAAKQHSDVWGDSPRVPSLSELLGGKGETGADIAEAVAIRDVFSPAETIDSARLWADEHGSGLRGITDLGMANTLNEATAQALEAGITPLPYAYYGKGQTGMTTGAGQITIQGAKTASGWNRNLRSVPDWTVAAKADNPLLVVTRHEYAHRLLEEATEGSRVKDAFGEITAASYRGGLDAIPGYVKANYGATKARELWAEVWASKGDAKLWQWPDAITQIIRKYPDVF